MRKTFESGKSSSETARKILLHWAFWKKATYPKLILFTWKKTGRLHLKNYSAVSNFTMLKLK